MTLTLRPTGLGAGIDKDRPDYTSPAANGRSAASIRRGAVPTVCAGSGRYRQLPDETRADRVATFNEAKAKFRKCWDAWNAWVERLNFFP